MADELLLAAAAKDDVDELIRLVVEDGADANVQDANGQTPLHKAAALGSLRMVEALITVGALVDAHELPALGAATPLVLAVRGGHLECVDALADAGADVNTVCPLDGTTPLHDAAARGCTYMVKYLLSRGADAGLRDTRGTNASHHAYIAGFKEVGLIVGMPPPAAPLPEEVVAYNAFRVQQYAALLGVPAAKAGGGGGGKPSKKK